MTHNQFSGRTLSPNFRDPISPYTDRRRRRPPAPTLATVIAKWKFSGAPTGHLTSIDTTYTRPTRTGSLIWATFFTWPQTWPGALAIHWDPSLPEIFAELLADYGGGLLQIDTSFPAADDASGNFDSGPLSWHSWTGTMELSTQGFWQP